MTDMENKTPAPEGVQEEQAQQSPENGTAEPVEDGFSQPPAPETPEEGEPVPPETQEPVYPQETPPAEPEVPAPQSVPEVTPPPPVWEDVSSSSPAGQAAAVPQQPGPGEAPAQAVPPAGATAPPPVWQGQPGYMPQPGTPWQTQNPAAWQGTAAPMGWQGQTGYAPQPGQPMTGAPYAQPYYGGYPGYYNGYPAQPGAAAPGTIPAGTVQPQQTPTAYPNYYGGYQPYPFYTQYGQTDAAEPVAKVKKKKPVALKVFLWIVSILAAGALVGFGIYLAVDSQVRDGKPDFDGYYSQDPAMPPSSLPDEEEPDDPESETPNDGDEVQEPLPNVDVTPNTEGIQVHPKPDGEPLEPEELYDQVVKSTVAVTVELTRDGQTAQSRGTGIIATTDGYIITNAHVVLNSKSSRITVETHDGEEYEAVVVGLDRTTDLAVIKTNDHDFTPAVFGDAEELSMGEWVMALGNPGGTKFANSLTRGIVSGLNREAGQYSANGMTYIQTDAAINPGNSGGPLVNMYGQVVGINSSKIVTENYEGMGFAIPVSEARPIINELLSGGYIKGRTRLGIMIREIDSATSVMTQMPMGLLITEINEDSAFVGTEAREGDIITALDGETVSSLRDVSDLLLNYAPGDEITVTLYRPASNGRGSSSEFEVTVTLLEDKGETQE